MLLVFFTDEGRDSFVRGSPLKTLLIPISVVALGLLLALPFRRSGQAVDDLTDANTATPFNSGTVASEGLPTSIAPLRMDSNSELLPDKLLSAMKPIAAPPTTSRQPKLDSFPRSYDDVAVPLADRDSSKNLLKQQSESMAHRNLTGNRWTFDRFGIPRPIEELQTGEVDGTASIRHKASFGNVSFGNNALTHGVSSEHHGDDVARVDSNGQWSEPQPLRERNPVGMVLASDLKQRAGDDQAASTEEFSEVQHSDRQGVTFQSVKARNLKLLESGTAQSGPDETASVAQTTEQASAIVAEPAERKRFWIHEPSSN